MKVTLCVSMKDDLQDTLIKGLKSQSFAADTEFELVHVFEEQNYPYMIPPYIYPAEDQKPTITEASDGVLKQVAEKAGLPTAKTSVTTLFSDDSKHMMVEHLKKTKSDLVIAATEGRRGLDGLFHSSFADYLLRYSPSHVLVLRPL